MILSWNMAGLAAHTERFVEPAWHHVRCDTAEMLAHVDYHIISQDSRTRAPVKPPKSSRNDLIILAFEHGKSRKTNLII
jgi:hypothetical protein